jgi:hypothetical protein
MFFATSTEISQFSLRFWGYIFNILSILCSCSGGGSGSGFASKSFQST